MSALYDWWTDEDADDDGILDAEDFDDDNDGVLDVDESIFPDVYTPLEAGRDVAKAVERTATAAAGAAERTATKAAEEARKAAKDAAWAAAFAAVSGPVVVTGVVVVVGGVAWKTGLLKRLMKELR